ncbi:MAG: asparagine synthase (glutamine-hydrolyzing) [Acidobacteria bacterium]|nr:asparagine synthase (glutamine-hydrolyzing) [Acidobacteriota bacterium]
MCGIAGVISRTGESRRGDVDRMIDALVHRGPDGGGSHGDNGLVFGMRRLSIIDLAGGGQPLYNEDRSLALVANGEIYNYRELRSQLLARGHRFRSASDCEVILHLYEDYQAGCLDRLRGMFAFALWDSQRQLLFLARDRMGEKPLYLRESGDEIIFSSELKSLLKAGSADSQLDPISIDQFFHYGYIPEPRTPILGIRKLRAGHYLMVRTDEWEVEERCWWRMEDAPPRDGNPAEVIRHELEAVSELIIRADVPVGVALSGGIDSSAVAALAHRHYPGTIEAFSVGYEGSEHNDERGLAREYADILGIPFHETVLGVSEVVAGFPELIRSQDDPIADIAGSGYLAVMKLARARGVPVILQGHGGDELFWGYPWARQAVAQSRRKFDQAGSPRFADYLKLRLPASTRRAEWLRFILDAGGIRSSLNQYRRDLESPSNQLVFYDLSPDFQSAQRGAARLYPRHFVDSLGDADPTDLFRVPDPAERIDQGTLEVLITKLLCQTYLLENGVAQGDRLSMAASVELRLPLIDYRLVEVVIGLRKTRPDSALAPKCWLRAALEGILPSAVLARPKRGFTPPVRTWHKALFRHYGDRLRGGVLVARGVLDPAAAIDLAKGPFPLGLTAPLSFKALVLEEWCRNFLE